MSKVHIGRKVLHKKEPKYGWIRNLSSNEIDLNKPVVLCLPGDGAFTEVKNGKINDASYANGIAKVVVDFLGKYDCYTTPFSENTSSDFDDVQVIACEYPNGVDFSKERTEFALNKSEEISSYIKDIYDTVISSAIKDKNGKPYSQDKAKKQLRKLTIFGHCHGSYVSSKLIGLLKDDITNLGYENIQELLNEVVKISISPRIGTLTNDWTQHYAFTLLDDTMKDYSIPEGKNPGIYWNDNIINVYPFFANKVMDGENFAEYDSMHELKSYLDDDYMVFCVNKSAKEVLKNGEILTIDGISKNSNGKNFSRLIRRVLANSVSLSKIGEKRCFQNIVSNSTEIVYVFDIKHGLSHEFCIKKDSFEFDNSKLNKDEQLKLAIRKLESKMNKESENIVSVPNGRE